MAAMMKKKRILKDDGRYLIYYEFPGSESHGAPETPGARSAGEQAGEKSKCKGEGRK
ncbi:MAG TPA: hypothetical protein GXX51_00965 [Firmicutes bacterium]|nr:hypothetical protein [Bacillota bacterium]